jgi:hypothetical protein
MHAIRAVGTENGFWFFFIVFRLLIDLNANELLHVPTFYVYEECHIPLWYILRQ